MAKLASDLQIETREILFDGDWQKVTTFVYDEQLVVCIVMNHYLVMWMASDSVCHRFRNLTFHNLDDAVAAINELEDGKIDWQAVMRQEVNRDYTQLPLAHIQTVAQRHGCCPHAEQHDTSLSDFLPLFDLTEEPLRANAQVWCKRIFQLPRMAFNHRTWTVGISWDEPEVGGWFRLHFGPVGIGWEMWP